MENKSIGLDIDGVLSNFSQAVLKRARKMGLGEHFPRTWLGVSKWDISPKFSAVMKDAWLDPEFWLSLEPMVESIPFEVDCYITARPIATEVTKQWLDKQGFPKADVISVTNPEDKVEHILERKLDVFVDDLYSTVITLRSVGVNAILMKAPYQRGHEEECKGLPTIKSLEELLNYE